MFGLISELLHGADTHIRRGLTSPGPGCQTGRHCSYSCLRRTRLCREQLPLSRTCQPITASPGTAPSPWRPTQPPPLLAAPRQSSAPFAQATHETDRPSPHLDSLRPAEARGGGYSLSGSLLPPSLPPGFPPSFPLRSPPSSRSSPSLPPPNPGASGELETALEGF